MCGTYRRVEVHKNRAGNVFAAAGLGEEGIVGATGTDLVGDVGIVATVGLEAMLEQVPGSGE